MKAPQLEITLHPQSVLRPLPAIERRVVLAVIARLRHLQGALLPILHGIMDELRFVPPGAVALIAAELNLSRAEVHGVVTFYHHFRTSLPGRHVLRLCRAEACQALGARALEAHAMHRLGIGFHATTPDGRFTLEPVYCLGNCACGPSLSVDDELVGRVTEMRFDALLDALP